MTESPRWEPRNPEFEHAVRDSFARQAHMGTLGARLTRIEPGAVDITAPFDARFTQQNGYWHAGAVTSIADSACGYAAFSLAAAGTDVLAVEFKINLLAPARGDVFRAVARVLRSGRTLTVCSADVFALDGDDSTLIATMLSTAIIREVR